MTHHHNGSITVCCPASETPVAPLHPRIYLTLSSDTPQQHCPYCGKLWCLKDMTDS